MFDIPELDQKVCSQLNLGSLAQCAQVSKKWNRVLAPSVWHTIPEDTKHHDWRGLCQLVLEDLLQERQHTRTGTPHPSSAVCCAALDWPGADIERTRTIQVD